MFGHKCPLTLASSVQTSGGVIDSLPQSVSAAELVPGNVLAVDKILKSHLVVRLQDDSLRTISHSQFYSYLIDAQDSQFSTKYLNLLDVYTCFENISGFDDFLLNQTFVFLLILNKNWLILRIIQMPWLALMLLRGQRQKLRKFKA